MGRLRKRLWKKQQNNRTPPELIELTDLRHLDHLILLDHPLSFTWETRPSGGVYVRFPGYCTYVSDETDPVAVAAKAFCTGIGPCSSSIYPETEKAWGEYRLGMTVIFDVE